MIKNYDIKWLKYKIIKNHNFKYFYVVLLMLWVNFLMCIHNLQFLTQIIKEFMK